MDRISKEIEMRRSIRIFAVNDYEWWAGESETAVIAEMCKQLDCADKSELLREEYIFDDGIVGLSEGRIQQLIYHDDDDVNGEVVKRTFREQLDRMILAGQAFPCLFATTED
jgi:hypothetical protein